MKKKSSKSHRRYVENTTLLKKTNQDDYNTIAKGCTTKSKLGTIIFSSIMFLSKKKSNRFKKNQN
jgi:hypothetical protein